MSNILHRIGKNIRESRESKGLTQAELAAVCGFHRNYISSLERGSRNISVLSLARIADGLKLRVERLLQ